MPAASPEGQAKKNRRLRGNPLKYQQVLQALEQTIRQGKIRPGDRLAPIDELSVFFGLSRSVVHRALQSLSDRGMIEARGNHGYYVLRPPAGTAPDDARGSAPEKTAPRPDRRTFLSCGYHSDLVWRRTFEEYEAIRARQFDQLVEWFRKYPRFVGYVEQACILRDYLARRPETLPFFKTLVAQGRLSLTGGDLIPDQNLTAGETLVRTLQAGRNWYRETFGVEVELANLNDSFGMAWQVPQVLRQSGYRFLIPGYLPTMPREVGTNRPFLWEGLDGSAIPVIPPVGDIDHAACQCNYPLLRTPETRLRETLLAARRRETDDDLLLRYTSEENLLQESLFRLVDEVNRLPGHRMIDFAPLEQYAARLDPDTLPVVRGEFNPVNTGCYTTRIGLKQAFRAAENLLFAAELAATLSTATAPDFADAWRRMALASFHDAICGCHTDAGSRQIAALIDRTAAEAFAVVREAAAGRGDGCVVVNPSSTSGAALVAWTDAPADATVADTPAQREVDALYFVAALPSCGVTAYPTVAGRAEEETAAEAVFETDGYAVDFRAPYPVIRAKRCRANVFAPEGFGEILYRHDPGTMWRDCYLGMYIGREHFEETVASVTAGPVFHRVVVRGVAKPKALADSIYEAVWSGFESLSYTKEYRFPKTLDYFTLRLTLDWRGCDTKIHIRFPLNLDVTAAGTYAVPFGSATRSPYYEVPPSHEATLRQLHPEDYPGAGGDWPALHWVDYGDANAALALANTGTPGHQATAGFLQVSLLRSGTRTADGSLKPDPGVMDNGRHEYDFAFRAHDPEDTGAAPALGRVLNRRPLAFRGRGTDGGALRSVVSLDCDNVEISSIRPCEDGFIVRIFETLGRATRVTPASGLGPFTLWWSDLQERDWTPVEGGSVVLAPLQICTLKFRPA